MGTWGAGNFDSDAALDVLDAVTDVIDPEINGFLGSDSAGVEDVEQVLACVAIRLALIIHCTASSPSEEEAKALRAKILDIFDREFDNLQPSEGFKEARRKVILNTLDELVRVAAARPAP